MPKVRIACETKLNLPLSDLNVFQGELKELSKERYEQLKNEILTMGFSAPFFVWKNQGKWNLLDGHQRMLSLGAMAKEGIELPANFPCVEIHAKDENEAAQKLLGFVSQFGEVTGDGLRGFVEKYNIEVDDLEKRFSLPDFNVPKFKAEFYEDAQPKETKTKLIKCPNCEHEFEK